MRLPEGMTIYIGGKKYTRNIPDELAPPGISGAAETKPLKKIDKKDKEKEGK